MSVNVRISQPKYSPLVEGFLKREHRLLIGGNWVEAMGSGRIGSTDPSTGEEVASFPDGTEADVDRAVRAARLAFDDGRWSEIAPMRREIAIHRLANLLESNAEEFAELESIDNGKTRAMSSAVDVPSAVTVLRYTAGWASKVEGRTVELASDGWSGARFHTYIRREPVGVVAQIIPWNFPLLMAITKLAPALAAGCTMVLKPAEQTSLSALRLGDLILESGIPAGVVNIVTGRGETVGEALVRHPLVDKIAFTGSTEIGKRITRAAADTLKRVTLELGGKSPVIVMPDVNLKDAITGAANAIFFNHGQVCVAGSRLYAHRSIFDRLVEGVVEAADAIRLGASLDAGTEMGPLVSAEQQRRVLGYVELGQREGAKVLTGGHAPFARGYFVKPTVMIDVKPEMRVVREEIFGPVLVAQRFDDLEEVARQANDSPFGLAASIWTRDLGTMHRLAGRIRAGTVWGNCHGIVDAAAPFGGFKQSGLGREFGRDGVEAYTELKTVCMSV